MRLFSCQSCAQILFFENVRCERCFHTLGFWPDQGVFSALEPAPAIAGADGEAATGVETWEAIGIPGRTFRLCANAQYDVCNWLVDVSSGETMCAACRHNKIIPELNITDNKIAWHKIEMAKHRLFYTLFRLGLAQAVDMGAQPEPLVFQFLADVPNVAGEHVMTGHDDGVITIALSEADDAERELRRKLMGEPYRTLLGHFRHEVGHFFWDKIVRDGGRLDACRAVFGDDTQDYEAALKTHYEHGAPGDWQQNFVSTYATAHPWEDFAETWAHYLHIVDTLEMAGAYGLALAPSVDQAGEFDVGYGVDPYTAPDIKAIVDVWLPVSTALNSMNRAMGKEELYPFILSPDVINKLGFMHGLIRDAITVPTSAPLLVPGDTGEAPLNDTNQVPPSNSTAVGAGAPAEAAPGEQRLPPETIRTTTVSPNERDLLLSPCGERLGVGVAVCVSAAGDAVIQDFLHRGRTS